MATNADQEDAVDSGATVTEEDIRNLKYSEDEVETADKAEDDAPEEDGVEETDEDTGEEADSGDQADGEEEAQSPEPTFVKEFPHIKGDTPEEYARNLEKSYQNSTSEALRLKQELDKTKAVKPPLTSTDSSGDDDDEQPLTAEQLWLKQQMDEEIANSFESFKKDYPQVDDPDEYDKFKAEVSVFSNAIRQAQGRMATPAELYQKAALSLGWDKQSEPSDKEKLGIAIKDSGGTSKAITSGAKPPAKSKVTDAQIATYRKMNPSTTLSDTDIRKELEPHIT